MMINPPLDKTKQESEEDLKKSLERNEMIAKGITNMVLTLAKMAENPKPLRSRPYKFPVSETYTLPQAWDKKPLTTDEMARILANDYAGH